MKIGKDFVNVMASIDMIAEIDESISSVMKSAYEKSRTDEEFLEVLVYMAEYIQLYAVVSAAVMADINAGANIDDIVIDTYNAVSEYKKAMASSSQVQ